MQIDNFYHEDNTELCTEITLYWFNNWYNHDYMHLNSQFHKWTVLKLHVVQLKHVINSSQVHNHTIFSQSHCTTYRHPKRVESLMTHVKMMILLLSTSPIDSIPSPDMAGLFLYGFVIICCMFIPWKIGSYCKACSVSVICQIYICNKKYNYLLKSYVNEKVLHCKVFYL